MKTRLRPHPTLGAIRDLLLRMKTMVKKKRERKRKGLTKHRKRRERNEDLDIWKLEPHNWGQSHEKKKKKDDGLIMLEDQEEDP